MQTVAALFVETNGCYFGLPGIDPGISRATPGIMPARGQSFVTPTAGAGVASGTAAPGSRISSSSATT